MEVAARDSEEFERQRFGLEKSESNVSVEGRDVAVHDWLSKSAYWSKKDHKMFT